MQDLRDVMEASTTLSFAGGCWSRPKVETADESGEIFIDDFHTTSRKVSKNKYGMKLLKEF